MRRPTLDALPPDRAFVVQLCEGVTTDASLLRGRIEHVISGQAQRFDSTAQMLVFMDRVLASKNNQSEK